MNNDATKFRVITSTVLFLALTLITTFSWYSINEQTRKNYREERKEHSNIKGISEQSYIPGIVITDTTSRPARASND